MELSFCITCMNRINQIKQTLIKNLNDNKNTNIEFILVDFNSSDGLKDYIFTNRTIKKYLINNQLKYFFTDKLKYWHASIAKNTSHLLASGNIVVNLDCDNFIGENGGDILLEQFKNKGKNIIISQSSEISGSGTAGRISLSKENFLKLGGYNEQFYPMGYQDTDLVKRATKLHIKFVHLNKNNVAIANSKNESIKNCNTKIEYYTMENTNKLLSNINIENNELVANKYKSIGIEL